MELIATIIFLIVTYVLSHLSEWKSNNRLCPPGYHMDWTQASEDIRKYGKQYYYNKHLRGGYDIKDK